jgi:hypothetical protein
VRRRVKRREMRIKVRFWRMWRDVEEDAVRGILRIRC